MDQLCSTYAHEQPQAKLVSERAAVMKDRLLYEGCYATSLAAVDSIGPGESHCTTEPRNGMPSYLNEREFGPIQMDACPYSAIHTLRFFSQNGVSPVYV